MLAGLVKVALGVDLYVEKVTILDKCKENKAFIEAMHIPRNQKPDVLPVTLHWHKQHKFPSFWYNYYINVLSQI